MARLFSRFLLFLVVLSLAFAAWVYFSAWRSPDTFPIDGSQRAEYPLISWDDYEAAASQIRPPYLFEVDPLNDGAVYLFGAEHGRPLGDVQYRLIEKSWTEFQPTIAMVEGRLGFFVPYIMDPILQYGESGFVASLAKADDVPLYSWELSKADEITALKRTHTEEQVALFIILRPYWGSVGGTRLPGADEIVEELIADRGSRPGIEGAITSIADIDRIWARDFPDARDWRDQQFSGSLPGYAGELFEQANNVRASHMLDSIMRLTGEGERVYVSAGWSHVIRVEPVFSALRRE